MIECSWKSTFGIDCLFCGFQRSVELLFKGQFVDSLIMFPATLPFILSIVLLVVHLTVKLNNGHRWILGFFGGTACLLVINLSIKVINGSAFH